MLIGDANWLIEQIENDADATEIKFAAVELANEVELFRLCAAQHIGTTHHAR
jgi:hypothetical protein